MHQRHILFMTIAAAFPCSQQALASDDEATLRPVVSTARRVDTRLDDVPQRIEVVDRKDIDKTIHNDLTDLLKKNASVDVVQYPGALSGIGIRGFRPEYGGINRHTALLVDGRPVATDNLAMINAGSIDRVEVMKGPGSALYGSGAMGGVVNMISRQSRGDIRGQANLSLGQFDTKEIKLRAGGSLNRTTDFDYAGSLIKAGDFKLGNGGNVRPLTGYDYESHSIRGGVDIDKDWRLVGKWTDWKGRDVGSPGDLAYGTNAQARKQMANSDRDLRLTGRLGDHALSVTAFSGTQTSETTTLTSTTASYRPQLPALSSAGELTFSGWQAQDAWAWSADNVLLFGIDAQKVQSVSRSWNLAVAGAPRKAPGTADNRRVSTGVFAENSWTFNDGNSTAYAGIRRDAIAVETLDTPYRVGFAPSKADYTATNPSAGIKHSIVPGWSLHATIGKAFVAPDALYVTGNHATARGAIFDYTIGNPAIEPETSLTKDVGVEWGSGNFNADLTVFDTRIVNRIVQIKTTDTSGGPNNGGVTTTYANADGASAIRGLEWQGRWGFAGNFKLTFGGTRYFHDRDLVNGSRVDVNNVPRVAVKVALDADIGPWTGRLGLRYRGPIKDQDWVTGGGRQVEQGGFSVVDLNVRYRIDKAQSVALSVENLGDRFYTEKFGYNMSGRNMRSNYRYEF